MGLVHQQASMGQLGLDALLASCQACGRHWSSDRAVNQAVLLQVVSRPVSWLVGGWLWLLALCCITASNWKHPVSVLA